MKVDIMRVKYEPQYSADGKKWYRYMQRFDDLNDAITYAQARRYDDNHTRVVKIISEVIATYSNIPGKKAPPLYLNAGKLGMVEFK